MTIKDIFYSDLCEYVSSAAMLFAIFLHTHTDGKKFINDLTAKEIAEYLPVSANSVPGLTKSLKEVGFIRDVDGQRVIITDKKDLP